MRSEFEAFYRPTDKQFRALWDDGLIIVDASVLLGFYRYPKEIRSELFDVFKKVKLRLRVPFHGALEFHRNRPSVIAEQKKRFSDTSAIVNRVVPDLTKEFEKLQIQRRHSTIKTEKFIIILTGLVDSFLNELNTKNAEFADVHEADRELDRIEDLFSAGVGQRPTQEDIDNIEKQGAKRFACRIPPGYEDEKKSAIFTHDGVVYSAKYGDLIVWNQVIALADTPEHRPVMFVTDDNKEDWWWQVDSQGKKQLGPRPELVDEMLRLAKPSTFWIYNLPRFLENAKKYLQAKISQETIDEVRELGSTYNHIYDAITDKYIDRAVISWISDTKNGVVVLPERDSWADYVAESVQTRARTGIEIIRFISVKATTTLLKLLAGRVITLIQDGPYVGFEVAVVAPDENAANMLANAMLEYRIYIPSEVNITIGVLKGNALVQNWTFAPIHRFRGPVQFSQ